MQRSLFPALPALLGLVLTAGPAVSDDPKPLDDPAAFVARVGAILRPGNDPGALASVFTDDIVWEGGACELVGGTCTGLDELKHALAARGPLGQTRITKVQASGSTIFSRTEVRGPEATAAGIDRWILDRVWKLRGDKIAHVQIVFDANDPQTAKFVEVRKARNMGVRR